MTRRVRFLSILIALAFTACGASVDPRDFGADASIVELGSFDASEPIDADDANDANAPDVNSADAIAPDAKLDSGPPDSGEIDAGFVDSGPADSGICVPRDGGRGALTSSTPPSLLSETGLYTNTASKTLSPEV